MSTDQDEETGRFRNGALRKLRLRAAYVVLGVFLLSVIVDMSSLKYETPPGLTALTAVVGVWLFGVKGSHD